MSQTPVKPYLDIHDWIMREEIKNEKGDRIEFDEHPFLFDIYADQTQHLTVMKAAQVGLTTAEMLKNHFDAKQYNLDIIYTLPTDGDVKVMVGGKMNRIIANNPTMLNDVTDKDSVESKQIGGSMIYFRGTFTKKAAMMTPADRVVHDEIDSSKLEVISDFQARLQHSKHKQTHVFSHPSLPETGVHAEWIQSDQKHWFVKCPHCSHWQYLSWNMEDPSKMSVDLIRKKYICKKCKKDLPRYSIRDGQWVARYPERSDKRSGYWVPLLICTWISPEWLVDKFQHKDTTKEFFYTKILGIPHADASSKLLRKSFMQNLTGKPYAPGNNERVVLGIDTGLKLDYVIGDKHGVFYQDDCEEYKTLDGYMDRWKKMIAVIDAGGDLIGSRAFAARWPGRVFLCYLGGDKKNNEIFKWGKKDEHGAVHVDRNRAIQLVVDEFRTARIPVHGTEEDWYEYWLDWNNLSKLKILDSETNAIKGYKWVRSGRDHRALATVFWRVGMSRFATTGEIIGTIADEAKPNSYEIGPDNTVSFDPEKLFDLMEDEEQNDWRVPS